MNMNTENVPFSRLIYINHIRDENLHKPKVIIWKDGATFWGKMEFEWIPCRVEVPNKKMGGWGWCKEKTLCS